MQRRVSSSGLILAVLLLLLALVALASRPFAQAPAVGLAAPEWIAVAADTIVQMLLILLLAAALAATAFNVWVVLPLPRVRPRPRPFGSAAVAYLYFGAAVCFLILLRARLARVARPPSASAGGILGFASANGLPGARGITWLSILAAIAILAVAALLLLRWWRAWGASSAAPEDRGPTTTPEPPHRLAPAIGESLDALRAEPDPRRAVIAAYACLETELRAMGRPRHPAEAPLEYLARILAAFRVNASALRRLTDLFEWAKFSHHEVDRTMKDEAIDALQRLVG